MELQWNPLNAHATSTPPVVRVVTEPHKALVRYQGDICHHGADQLEQQLALHADYYHYTAFDLGWDSNGGCALAMRRIMDAMQRLHAKGFEVTSSASGRACSAAAVLLSGGAWGSRSVKPHTTLLYHRAGFLSASHRLTEGETRQITRELKRLDAELIDGLLSSGLRAVGSRGLQETVTTRCRWLQDHWSTVIECLSLCGGHAGLVSRRSVPAWLAPTRLQDCRDPGLWLEAYRNLLASMLNRDQAISPLQAWGWGLVDTVEGVVEHDSPNRAVKLPAAWRDSLAVDDVPRPS